MSKRTTIIIAAVTAALASGGAAVASIPDGTGVITTCYDSSGSLRVIDTATTTACPSGQTKLAFNQQGRQGPTGPRGPAGPSNLHWIKVNKSGTVVAKTDSTATVYTGSGYVYFGISGVDLTNCAITVQPYDAMFSDGPITTSYVYYNSSNWVYARAQQMHPNNQIDYYPQTGFDVTIAC